MRFGAQAFESADWIAHEEGNFFTRQRFDPNLQLTQYDGELHALPEYEEALRAIRADEWIEALIAMRLALVPITFWVDERLLIDGVLYEVARASPDDRDTIDAFSEIYQAMEEAVYATTIRYVVILPLPGLSSPESLPVELDPGVQIQRLSDEDVVRCIQAGLLRSESSWSTVFVGDRIGLRVVRSIERPAFDNQDANVAAAQASSADASEIFERFVTSLRLASRSLISTPGHLTYADNWFGKGALSWGLHTPGATTHPPRTSLAPSEAAALVEFWSDLGAAAVVSNNTLQSALRRVRFAFERPMADDRLVDLMIAAETFFLPDSHEGELRFKLALRAGLYLDDVGADRGERYRRMREAYDVRSRIVHGVRLEKLEIPAGFTLETFADEVGSYIRSALSKAVRDVAAGGSLPDWHALVLGT